LVAAVTVVMERPQFLGLFLPQVVGGVAAVHLWRNQAVLVVPAGI